MDYNCSFTVCLLGHEMLVFHDIRLQCAGNPAWHGKLRLFWSQSSSLQASWGHSILNCNELQGCCKLQQVALICMSRAYAFAYAPLGSFTLFSGLQTCLLPSM